MPKFTVATTGQRARYVPLMLQNRRKGFIGRNWPPTNLTAEFENYTSKVMNGTDIGSINNVSKSVAFQLTMTPDWGNSAWFIDASDATGTRAAFTESTPRNWTSIVPLYTRGRLKQMTFLVKILTVTGDVADPSAGIDFYVSSWLSSNLDKDNPITSFDADLGAGGDFAATNLFRDKLLKSRRVHTEVLQAKLGGGEKANGVLTLAFKLQPYVDRVGNITIGGKHIRVITDHGGGTIAATDVAVASLLTDFSGVNNRINVMIYPVNQGLTTPKINTVQIWSRTLVELYDRVHDTT